MKTLSFKSSSLLLTLLAGPLASPGVAATYTWTGASGTTWSLASNWSPSSTAPAAGDTANILSSSTNQTVVYDSAASGTLGTLSISQTSAATNQLTLLRNLTVSSAITLGASNGGSSVIYLDGMDISGTTGASGSAVLTVSSASGIVINSGGVLGMSVGGASNTYQPYVAGNVTVSGGALIIYSGKVSSAATVGNITGSFTMSSGTLVLGSTAKGGSSTDVRLSITGNCNITGGVISGTTGTLNLYGSTNTISGILATNSAISNVTLYGSAASQNFTSNSTTDNAYISSIGIRGGGSLLTRTLGATSGTLSFGRLYTGNTTASGTTVMRLSSDMVLSFTAPITSQYGAGSSTTIYSVIDLSGNNLFSTTSTGTLQLTNVSSSSAVKWSLINSGSTGGVIQANALDFSSASQVDVGTNSSGTVTLVATGAGYTNNLGSSGTIAGTSIFSYVGTSGSLTAGRAIGRLSVGNATTSSTLSLVTSDLSVQGDVTVNSKGVLNLAGKNLTETGASTTGGLNGSGTVVNQSTSAVTLTLNTQHGNGVFSGAISDGTSSGTVAVTLTGGTGTQIFTGTNTYTGATTISAGNTLQLGDGTNDGVISSNSAISNNGALLYNIVGSQNYSGTVSGTGTVTKLGEGTQKLSGYNTYTGKTQVQSGKMAVSGTLSATSGVSVNQGAELNVTGLINQSATISLSGKLTGSGVVGAVQADSTAEVDPGNGTSSIGTLTTEAFTLANTSTVAFDLTIGNTTMGSGINDLIAVNGNLTLDGVLNLNFIGTGLASGTYTLFTYTGTLTDNTLDLSQSFLTTYEGSHIDTSTVGVVDLIVVPEPGTWAFLSGGIGLLLGAQRWRSARRRNA